MARRKSVLWVGLTAVLVAQVGWAATMRATVEALADMLEQGQTPASQQFQGYWLNTNPLDPSEKVVVYLGSTTAGMVGAYDVVGQPPYLISAAQAGRYMSDDFWRRRQESINEGQDPYMPPSDDAYAMIRLWQASGDEDWIADVRGIYNDVSTMDTCFYVGRFIYEPGAVVQPDPYEGVFYLAHHVLAAYAVDANDKEMYRRGLILALGYVDDEHALCPVQALGAAVWALAATGPLDDTLVAPDWPEPTGLNICSFVPDRDLSPVWQGKALKDLPAMLLSHQVPPGEPDEGSFYWRFDHTDGNDVEVWPVSGFTEDTVYCTLGLTSMARRSGDPNDSAALKDPIVAATRALIGGVNENGQVGWHLTLPMQEVDYDFFYAGEVLEAMTAVRKLDLDGIVDLSDLPDLVGAFDQALAP